ncbi:putative tellurium resistance membrane protein TerC [Microbacteriaceae bacterium SG_E_30_P1]|uniref:Tellurium resistance membrane protein TerC n=1 Tax=Antiquaquibacter oligotrophicus TaxID=2880260 RepID=A0ABT6KQG4_9MICO|nr:TerC family protein [Antiquaquibacter oligotrophicus]MDH6182225.1 putative tellurium resistance membrane protein TerC [Antiquaquibacter oligotrophicus]UDF12115.1 TerC family protein [Antiquaquibacter oligotrophicus]
MDFAVDLTPDLIVAFLTLLVLEIVLGVDNVIFISILASKLPVEQQAKARNLGLTLAMFMRIGLLFAASWLISLKDDLFTIGDLGFSGRDLVLIAGGGFLIYKAVHEIHEKLEGAASHHGEGKPKSVTFVGVIIQIILIDIVFSFDSVITAVGMIDSLLVIIVAVVLSFGVMLFSAKFIFAFVNKHPSVKMLALAFLVLIGVFLIADGFGVKIDKALIYVPMAFAIVVEALNLAYKRRIEKKQGAPIEPVHLRHAYTKADDRPAVAAATSHNPEAGAVTLSRKPVSGAVTADDDHQEPTGLG